MVLILSCQNFLCEFVAFYAYQGICYLLSYVLCWFLFSRMLLVMTDQQEICVIGRLFELASKVSLFFSRFWSEGILTLGTVKASSA